MCYSSKQLIAHCTVKSDSISLNQPSKQIHVSNTRHLCYKCWQKLHLITQISRLNILVYTWTSFMTTLMTRLNNFVTVVQDHNTYPHQTHYSHSIVYVRQTFTINTYSSSSSWFYHDNQRVPYTGRIRFDKNSSQYL